MFEIRLGAVIHPSLTARIPYNRHVVASGWSYINPLSFSLFAYTLRVLPSSAPPHLAIPTMFGIKLTSVVLLLSLAVASFASPVALPVSPCPLLQNLSRLLSHISKQDSGIVPWRDYDDGGTTAHKRTQD